MANTTGRKFGGRQKGAKNKRTVALDKNLATAAAVLAEVIPGLFAGDAHAFLVSVYKDPGKDLTARMDAAKAAIRYEKPAAAGENMDERKGPANVFVVPIKAESNDEWTASVRAQRNKE